MSDNDTEASIKVKWEGLDDANAKAEAFLTLLEKLRNLGSVNPAAPSGQGLPSGSGQGAINPGDGMGQYGPSTSTQYGLPQVPGGGYGTPVLNQGQSTSNPYALPPLNPGNGLGGGMGATPGAGGAQVVNAQTVIINGGGGSVNGATFHGGSQIPETPSAAGGGGYWNRVGNWFGGMGGGGGMETIIPGNGNNPLPGGAPTQSNGVGIPGWATGGAAAIDLALRTGYAYTQPTFMANLQIRQLQESGQYVNAIQSYSNRQIAGNEGELGAVQTGVTGTAALLGAFGGAAIGAGVGARFGLPGIIVGGAIGAGVLGSIGNTVTNFTLGRDIAGQNASITADRDRDMQLLAMLRRTGADNALANQIASAYDSGDSARIDALNKSFQSDPSRSALMTHMQIGDLSSVRALGTGFDAGMMKSPYTLQRLKDYISPNDIVSGENAYASALSNPAMGTLRYRAMHGGPIDMQSDILQQFIASGDTASILALQSAKIISQSSGNQALDAAFGVKQSYSGIAESQSLISGAMSGIQQRVSQGQSLSATGNQTIFSANLYGSQIGDLENVLLNQSSEQDRAATRAQIAALRSQQASAITSGTSMGFQQTELQIGIASAGVSRDITQAGLFGGPQQQYSASMEQVGVIRQQIDLQNQIVEAYKEHKKTFQEYMAAEKSLIDLKQQEITVTAQSARAFAQMNMSVAQANLSITQGQIGVASQAGLGGGSLGPLFSQGITQAGTSLTAAQANLDLLRKTNPEDSQLVQNAKQAVLAAQSGIIGAGQSQMASGPGASVQLAQVNAGMDLNVLTGTYAGFGDVRSAIHAKMSADAAAFQHYNQEYQSAGSTAEQQMKSFGKNVPIDPSTGLPITLQQLTTNNQLAASQGRASSLAAGVADQQQLQSGWMDRLISQTFNMPSRGAYVAAGFTQREAAPFVEGFSSAYGTTSAGMANAWRHYGDNIATSAMGINNVSNPQNFSGTGMNALAGALAQARSAPGALSAPNGVIRLEITLKDTKGNVTGRASTTGTIASLGAGAVQINQSPYTSSAGSHQ